MLQLYESHIFHFQFEHCRHFTHGQCNKLYTSMETDNVCVFLSMEHNTKLMYLFFKCRCIDRRKNNAFDVVK